MDWKMLAETAALGTPFTNIVIWGLVEWIKSLKNKEGLQLVTGNALQVSSLIVGMVLGSSYMFFANRPPLEADWYVQASYGGGLVIYGLVQGFIASKIYDMGVSIATKAK